MLFFFSVPSATSSRCPRMRATDGCGRWRCPGSSARQPCDDRSRPIRCRGANARAQPAPGQAGRRETVRSTSVGRSARYAGLRSCTIDPEDLGWVLAMMRKVLPVRHLCGDRFAQCVDETASSPRARPARRRAMHAWRWGRPSSPPDAFLRLAVHPARHAHLSADRPSFSV